MACGPNGNKGKLTPLSYKEVTDSIYKRFFELEETPPSAESSYEQDEDKFSMTPKDIKAYLDKYVISQERAKKDLAVAVSFHYSRISSDAGPTRKNNVLMIGPSGVGKTYILQKLSSILNVPFVEIDITKVTKTGYVGMNADDILKYVLVKTDKNFELAQKAIVYVDEIDKIRSQRAGGERDVAGLDVQTELLKILEGAEIPITLERDKIVPFNTKNMLFVCSGAFPELEPMISLRTDTQKRIGFSNTAAHKSTGHTFEKVTVDDLVKFGFLPEFMGRLPLITVLSPLGVPELKRILIEPEEALVKQYKNEMKPFGIEIEFTDDALDAICEKATSYKTGARALSTVCEDVLREFKYELPGSDITKLVITKETVNNPKAELEKLLGAK